MKNQISKEELTRISGEYQAKFGVKMDDWLTMILYELDEKMVEHNQKVDLLISKIEKVASFVRGETKSVHFSNNKEAFWFGFGSTLSLAIGISVIAIVGYFVFTNTRDFNEKKKFVSENSNYWQYRILMKNGQIFTSGESKYLVLKNRKKNTGDIEIGKEYEIDSKNKRILVPLGR
jgi:hypothetical protein